MCRARHVDAHGICTSFAQCSDRFTRVWLLEHRQQVERVRLRLADVLTRVYSSKPSRKSKGGKERKKGGIYGSICFLASDGFSQKLAETEEPAVTPAVSYGDALAWQACWGTFGED